MIWAVLETRDHLDRRLLDWSVHPLAVLESWPLDRPVVMVHSGRRHGRWARWSILAEPAAIHRIDAGTADPLAELDALLARHAAGAETGAGGAECPQELPFRGGWIGAFSYDLGRVIEPAARSPRSPEGASAAAVEDRAWPLIELAWCPGALIYDHERDQWHALGDPGPEPVHPSARDAEPVRWSSLTSSLPRAAYEAAVQRTIEYIRAGDIFQANITQRFSAAWSGSSRRLAAAALDRSGAWYGAYLELPEGRAVLSLSPELFLQVDPRTRQVITRPVKGTRPSDMDERELVESAKDAAELHMIIDLMRNDLGRVCEFGSVQVPAARTIETHPTVHHGVGEVTGRLRPGVSTGELLRATFPPGSVTGAPKIRAMQIIDELEPVRRGPYCGAIGMLSTCGRITLNVAIRTLLFSGRRPPGRCDMIEGVLDYGAGGGIVADSDPAAEYRESLTKAEILRQVLERP